MAMAWRKRAPCVARDLNSPFGMTLVEDTLYVANTDAVVTLPLHGGQTQITAPAAKVADLPGGALNHHWTKNVIASTDGSKLYVSVGSNSNVAEHGIDKEEGRAAIWEIDPRTGAHRVFASGPAQSGRHGLGARQRRPVDCR